MIPGPVETDGFEAVLAPLLGEPSEAAIFCDLDGTLAEIVARPEMTRIDDEVRTSLARIADRYAEVAVVTGRAAEVARRIVGIQKITYVGNHGFELLLPNAPEPRPAPELGSDGRRAAAFAAAIDPAELERSGLRLEDKGPIVAIHWRGAASEDAAEAHAEEIAADGERQGLVVHRGRKVLELRPAIDVDKGSAVESLVLGSEATAALYAGDDRTDLDGFAALGRLRRSGRLAVAVRVGVESAEGPAEIVSGADLTVAGPAGMIPVLRHLAG